MSLKRKFDLSRLDLCQDDWVEVYNVFKDNVENLMGRYCGMSAPGPIESDLGAIGVKIILHSDNEAVYSGFKARYVFEKSKNLTGGKQSYFPKKKKFWHEMMLFQLNEAHSSLFDV